MKSLGVVCFVTFVALQSVSAQTNPTNVTCTPNGGVNQGLACSQDRQFINTGSVGVSMTATCTPDNGQVLSAQSGVSVYGCFYTVNIFSGGRALSTSQQGGYGFIDTTAYAQFSFSGYVYWNMWDTQYCDGFRDRYVQPPAAC